MSRSVAVVMMVTFGALLLVGCSPDEPGHSSTTTTMSEADEAQCKVEGRTVETAIEAYGATTGAYPESISDLIPEWLGDPLRFEWIYTTDGSTFTLDGVCPSSGTTTTTPEAGEAQCKIEGRTVKTAIGAYRAQTGAYPESISDLIPEWLDGPLRFEWTYTTNGSTFTLDGECPSSGTTTTLGNARHGL
ncbi:MAG: hypothetical protein WBA45_04695 [Microthrixaceae bacterium]